MSRCEVEQRYTEILKAVKQTVKIPVAVKLSPYFSAMGNMARKLVDAGADGLVLFNRFYEPDIDLAQLTMLPNLELKPCSRNPSASALDWCPFRAHSGVARGQHRGGERRRSHKVFACGR
jgi:hypothetical protein